MAYLDQNSLIGAKSNLVHLFQQSLFFSFVDLVVLLVSAMDILQARERKINLSIRNYWNIPYLNETLFKGFFNFLSLQYLILQTSVCYLNTT